MLFLIKSKNREWWWFSNLLSAIAHGLHLHLHLHFSLHQENKKWQIEDMEYWWRLKNTGYFYSVLKLVAYYYLYLEEILKKSKNRNKRGDWCNCKAYHRDLHYRRNEKCIIIQFLLVEWFQATKRFYLLAFVMSMKIWN